MVFAMMKLTMLHANMTVVTVVEISKPISVQTALAFFLRPVPLDFLLLRLEMIFAMMNTIMLNADLMDLIAVDLLFRHYFVLNANAMVSTIVVYKLRLRLITLLPEATATE